MEIQVGAILLQMLNFGVLAGALTFLLLKPVRKILQERSRKVEQGQQAAQKAIDSQQTAEDKASKIVKKAQQEAKAIVDEGRKDATFRSKEIMAEAREEAQNIIAKARAEAKNMKSAALDEAKSEVEQVAVQIASQILGKEITAKKHSKLIEDSLEQIKKA